jgi:sugar phosphate isomerase/epimerase
MKKGIMICGPDVAHGPLALISGSFEEKVRKAAQLGFEGIELMVRDPAGLDWLHVKSVLRSANLEVPQIVTGELYGADGLCLVTADTGLYQRTEKRLHSVIDLAAYLGTMINLGRTRGRLDFLGNIPNAWDIAVDRMKKLGEYAAEKQVKITLEPLNRYESDFILNAGEGIRFIQAVGLDNLGLMLDLFHMNIEEARIEDGLRIAGDRLWHIHLADSNRRYPGSGHIQYKPIFATLKELDYQGYISAELLPLPDPDTAAQKTIEFLLRRENG